MILSYVSTFFSLFFMQIYIAEVQCRFVTPAHEGLGLGLSFNVMNGHIPRKRYPYVDSRSLPENGLHFNHSTVPPEYNPKSWNQVPYVSRQLENPGSMTFREWLREFSYSSHASGDFTGVQGDDGDLESDGGRRQRRDRALNVFLPDDRIVLDSLEVMDSFPYRATGALLLEGFGETLFLCSATVISEWLVLTNAHCVPAPGSLAWAFYFMNIGYTLADSNYKIRFGRYFTGSSFLDDYAILEMIEPIGRYTGWVGLDFRPLDYFTQKRTLSLIAYSGDILLENDAPAVTFDCSSRGILDGHVRHDCDATKGSSGAGMFGSMWYDCNETRCFDNDVCVCNYTGTGPYLLGINTWEFRNTAEGDSLIVDAFADNVSNGMIPTERIREAYETMVNLAPPIRCREYTNCSTCLTTVDCGWCSTTNSCMPGSLPGPLEPLVCPAWHWTSANCSSPSSTPTISPVTTTNATSTPTTGSDPLPPSPFVNGTLTPTVSCDTFTCPTNSSRKSHVKCVRSRHDCQCFKGYKYSKKSDSCEYCSTFECPVNSEPKRRTKCIKRSKDCRCFSGYEMKQGECVFCNSYTCPSNSRPHPRRQCITRFRHCLCNAGHKRKNEQCMPCDRLTCPANSVRRKVCVKNIRHCRCLEGYEKDGDICVLEQND